MEGIRRIAEPRDELFDLFLLSYQGVSLYNVQKMSS